MMIEIFITTRFLSYNKDLRDLELNICQSTRTEGLTFEDATVIALAIEIDAEIMLSDDATIRQRALAEVFQVTGTLGILLRTKSDGFIESVEEKIEILEAAGFRIHSRLKMQILQTSGEL